MPGRPHWPRRAATLAPALVLGFAILASGCGESEPEDDPRPNVIVITTDDQIYNSLTPESMPRTVDFFERRGMRFENYVATTPSCCPSRASFLTGQYAHNHGVLSNQEGYPALEEKGNTLPAWLQEAGYRTAQVGKFLNKYNKAAFPNSTSPAPGFDEWYSLLAPYRYYGVEMSINGRRVNYDSKPRNYLTRLLTRKAARFIKRTAADGDPFYLEIDHLAPHVGNVRSGRHECATTAVPDDRDVALARGRAKLGGPAVDEEQIADKPFFVSDLPRVGPKQRAKLRLQERCRLASLRAVDRGVARLREALRKAEELAGTMIVFVSDNGRFNGEHRLVQGKSLPYEEAVRLPMLMRLPKGEREGGGAGVIREPVANIDLAPTILDVTGVDPCVANLGCRVLDGRSILELMRGDAEGWRDRTLLLEYGSDGEQHDRLLSCAWRGVRTERWVYVRHTSVSRTRRSPCRPGDEVELYDLGFDPHQLRNLAGVDRRAPRRELELDMAGRLDELRDCAGIEGRDPEPASGHYCG